MAPPISNNIADDPFQIFEGPPDGARARPVRGEPAGSPRDAPAAPDDTDTASGPSGPQRITGLEESRLVDATVDASGPNHLVAARFYAVLPQELEQRMIETLVKAPSSDETIEAGYRRKEHELLTLLAPLTPLEARALHRRLTMPSGDDPLATHFGRLVPARRARVLAFLTDARRREAMAGTRRRESCR
ncbi:MAG TPA: hypothetical protein VK427_16545 [Kofleriaceae bacterium]|nr:hypothetical protein [Kofleriaceae bacterium]